MPTQVHATAIIDAGAELGDRVTVGPYAVIGGHVRIGDDTDVGSSVLLDGHTSIGCRNRVFHGASIGTCPQDLKYRGATSYVKIGDDNTFREFVTVNSATEEGESTVIGSHNLLMAYVHVAHNCRIHDNVTAGGRQCGFCLTKAPRFASLAPTPRAYIATATNCTSAAVPTVKG